MPRPVAPEDLDRSARHKTVATFHLDHFADDPDMVTLYAAFLTRAIELDGGPVPGSTTYAMAIEVPLPGDEISEALKRAQSQWDTRRDRYYDIQNAECGELLVRPYQDHEGWMLRAWATEEGLPILATFAEKK